MREAIDPTDELLGKLMQLSILTQEHVTKISKSGSTSYERAEVLLCIIRRRGHLSFTRFINVLAETNQQQLADKLGGNCESPSSLLSSESDEDDSAPVAMRDTALPSELLLWILLSVAVKWDLKRWRSTRLVRRDVINDIYRTLCSVCIEWSYIVRHKRFQRRFDRYMTGVCYPYRYRVKKQKRLPLKDGVTGVAQLGDRLYVTGRVTVLVRVYDCSTTDYAELEPIHVEVLKNPLDLTACEIHNRIYISDFDQCGIYYVDVETPTRRRQLSEHQAHGWLVKPGDIENPRGISVNPATGHVTVVSWTDEGHSQLVIVDPLTADHAQILPLPTDIEIPHHAIETPDGQFVVGHGRGEQTLHQVCVVSSTGEILKSFGREMLPVPSPVGTTAENLNDDDNLSPAEDTIKILADEDYGLDDSYDGYGDYRRLNTPYALAIDRFVTSSVVGRSTANQQWSVMVTDYHGRRILALDSNLNLMRTLLTAEKENDQMEEPRQVWIDSASGRLYVGQDSGVVDIFSVRDR